MTRRNKADLPKKVSFLYHRNNIKSGRTPYALILRLKVLFLTLIVAILIWKDTGKVSKVEKHIQKDINKTGKAIGHTKMDNDTTVMSNVNSNGIFKSYSMREKQIEHYKAGSALIFNVHITHHAGTTMCLEMSKWGPTPSVNCIGEENKMLSSSNMLEKAYKKFPWKNIAKTAKYVDSLRKYYHMISMEFRHHPTKRLLADVNWEYPNLLSVYISRDPIDRLLSEDVTLNNLYGKEEDRSKEEWHDFAKSWQANNYALNILSKEKECNSVIDHGVNKTFKSTTNKRCLESAKALLKRFTFVLDQACLLKGITKMAELLGTRPPIDSTRSKHIEENVKSKKLTAKERIPYNDVYNYIVEQNKMSIELYEWSKKISIVQC